MLPIKSNIAPDLGGMAFAIQPHGPNGAPVVCWKAEPVSVAADDAIGHRQQRKHGPAADERIEAADWLREQLASGPRPAKELIEEADGYGFSKRTLQRVFREDLRGKPSGDGFGGPVMWAIPIGATVGTNASCAKQLGTNGETWHQWENPVKQQHNMLFLNREGALVPSSESVAPMDAVASPSE